MKLACPYCGSNIIYVIGTEHVVCEHCGQKTNVSKINIDEYINYSKQLRDKEKDAISTKIIDMLISNTSEKKFDGLPVLICKKCKSQIVSTNPELIGQLEKCPYCNAYVATDGIIAKKTNITISKIIRFDDKAIYTNIYRENVTLPFYDKYAKRSIYKMYLPFLISYDNLHLDSKNVECDEKVMTLQYIGKSLLYEDIQKAFNFNFEKALDFQDIYLDDDTIIDCPFDDKETMQKRHRENVERCLQRDIRVEMQDLSFNLNEDKDLIECNNIKNEIILLPFYIYKDDKLTYIINGQNGEYTKLGATTTDTLGDRALTGFMVFPLLIFIPLSIGALGMHFIGTIHDLITLDLKEFFIDILMTFVLLLMFSPVLGIIKALQIVFSGPRYKKTKYKKEYTGFEGLSWNKKFDIKGGDANELNMSI